MSARVTPMIHVPDVRATVEWYTSIGFTACDTYDDGGDGMSVALLSFGTSEVVIRDLNRSWITFGQDIPER